MANHATGGSDHTSSYTVEISGTRRGSDPRTSSSGHLTIYDDGVAFVSVEKAVQETGWTWPWADINYVRKTTARTREPDPATGARRKHTAHALILGPRNGQDWTGYLHDGCTKQDIKQLTKFARRLQRAAERRDAYAAKRARQLDKLARLQADRAEQAARRDVPKPEPTWRVGEVVVDRLVASTYGSGWGNPFNQQVLGTLYATNQRLMFFTEDELSRWETKINDVRSVEPARGLGASLITANLIDGHRTWEPSCWSRPDRARFAANVRRIKLGLVTGPDDVPQLPSQGPARISEVGVKTAAGLACPSCHGTNFRLKRRLGKAATTGAVAGTLLVGGPIIGAAVGGAIGAKNSDEVECITCARVYRRG